MIPQDQLKYLKPLPDMVKRTAMVKRKSGKGMVYKKTKLTRRARQWASFIERIGVNAKYPSGTRSYGLLPMSERTKKK